ncbi:MAG: Ezrin/radixin/moesin family protein [Cytophagales bacterium]
MNSHKFVAIVVSFLFINFYAANGQGDPKAVRKEWAKKMKEVDPLEYKRMVEESQANKADLAAKSSTISEMQTSISQKEEEIRKLKEDLLKSNSDHKNLNEEHTSYKKSVQTATAPAKNTVDLTANNPETKEKLYKGGVIFKVQIGAFKNKDLVKYFENNKNFSGDVDADGVKKYTLGYFNDYWEADNFKKYIREMGVKDAWIVAYKDGKRVNLRDVLEGLL